MSENAIFCPRCDSSQVVKNGFIHNGNQNFKCIECQRQFVRNPRNKVIGEETKDLIDKLLLEKLPLAGIARITGVSNAMVTDLCQQVVCLYFKKCRSLTQKKGRLTIQCDEMWSFVGNKKNKHLFWLALDIETKEIIGVYVGNRSREQQDYGAHCLLFTDNVLCVIPISGLPIIRFFQNVDIKQ